MRRHPSGTLRTILTRSWHGPSVAWHASHAYAQLGAAGPTRAALLHRPLQPAIGSIEPPAHPTRLVASVLRPLRWCSAVGRPPVRLYAGHAFAEGQAIVKRPPDVAGTLAQCVTLRSPREQAECNEVGRKMQAAHAVSVGQYPAARYTAFVQVRQGCGSAPCCLPSACGGCP